MMTLLPSSPQSGGLPGLSKASLLQVPVRTEDTFRQS